MSRILKLRSLCALGVMALTLGLSSQADAQKLRRPFARDTDFNYGFDNRAGSGCTDWNCGSRCYDGHTGTDFPVPVGTPVLAGAAGRVEAVFNGCADTGYRGNTCGGRCGNYVRLSHADGTATTYCHMRRDRFTVSVGQQVGCGAALGQSASSGSSTGPHLHLSWRHGGVQKDSFRGSCTSSPGAWIDQRGYRQAPSAQCACTPSPEVCDGADNNCNGQIDEGGVCDVEALLARVATYAPARSTDVNGDGRADVCGRGGAGMWCHLATASGLTEAATPLIGLSDANGWKAPEHIATIRMGDVTGDGRAEVCARSNTEFACWRFRDTRWSKIAGPALSDASGWSNPQYYTTLRLADINGDGKDDVCARASAGIRCWLATGAGFGGSIAGPAWSDDAGFDAPKHYGTLRVGDFNGDGRDDLCIRAARGMICAPSTGAGFGPAINGPAWADSVGWGNILYWGSIRMGDVNGDGLADLCARSANDLRCVLSEGDRFGDTIIVAGLSDALGWSDVANHATLRMADVDGDGAQDLCVRSNARVQCYAWRGGSFTAISGPAWSDANGWDAPQHFDTLRFGDINGDGRADVCGRASAGLRCVRANASGFGGATWALDEFTNAGGWDQLDYYSSLQLGGPRCSTRELCNGRDDDCNGAVDDGPEDAGGDCALDPPDPCARGQLRCTSGALQCAPIATPDEPGCAMTPADMPDDMTPAEDASPDDDASEDEADDLGAGGEDAPAEQDDGLGEADAGEEDPQRPRSVNAEGSACICASTPDGAPSGAPSSLLLLALCASGLGFRRYPRRR